MTTLLMSSRHTEDNQALWRAAVGRGWTVVRARGIRVPEMADGEVVVYVESLFAPTIAKTIGRILLEPPDDWLVRLPQAFTRRRISLTTLGNARKLSEPSFVKPPNDKSFAARVYDSGLSLPAEYDDTMPTLVAEPVEWGVEFRCFCLDGRVQTLSPYLRSGALAKLDDFLATQEELDEATRIAEQAIAAAANFTPRAIVVDVGQVVNRGWAVVEANAAWGSGIYGCDPDGVLNVLRHATMQS